jgi:hypothetical protein
MTPYGNNSKSGISSYKIGDSFIIIKFKKSETYKYDYSNTGSFYVEEISNTGGWIKYLY